MCRSAFAVASSTPVARWVWSRDSFAVAAASALQFALLGSAGCAGVYFATFVGFCCVAWGVVVWSCELSVVAWRCVDGNFATVYPVAFVFKHESGKNVRVQLCALHSLGCTCRVDVESRTRPVQIHAGRRMFVSGKRSLRLPSTSRSVPTVMCLAPCAEKQFIFMNMSILDTKCQLGGLVSPSGMSVAVLNRQTRTFDTPDLTSDDGANALEEHRRRREAPLAGPGCDARTTEYTEAVFHESSLPRTICTHHAHILGR